MGEHSREVLKEVLGYADERIDELIRAGVVGTVDEVVHDASEARERA